MITAYLRVSSEKQDVAAQRGAIEEFAKLNSLCVEVWRDIEISSRKSMDDRGINALIGELKAGDVLIVSEISRLARSVGEISIICDSLFKKKVRLICVKERIDIREKKGKDLDLQSLTMVTLFSLFAEIERSIISQRTREGLAAVKARGVKLGCPTPELGAKATKDKADRFAEALRPKFDSMRGLTQRAMAERLNRDGIKPSKGGVWHRRSVQRVLSRLGTASQ